MTRSGALTSATTTPLRRADELGRGEQWLIYGLLTLNSLAYNYNFLLIDYVRPFLLTDLGWTLRDTALLYSSQAAGVIVGSFASAWWVARWNARGVLLVATFAIGTFTLLGLWVSGSAQWLGFRFLVGVALSATYVAATTMLANFFPPKLRGRLLSINGAMFAVALILIGAAGAALGKEHWRGLIWLGAAMPAAIFLFTAWLLPDDQMFSVYGDDEAATDRNAAHGSWREMLTGQRLKLTLACLLLAGLNFSGYQFYSGFITTYLQTVRQFDASATGILVTADGFGALLGGVLWGWFADRYGRRFNAWGFVLAAAFIVAYLLAPSNKILLYTLELGYAICLACTYCWGAYFAELFPVRLRPMGSSLFHGGHIISLFAPLLVTTVAQQQSLVLGMTMAPVTFLLAALVWWRLPETLHSSKRYRGFIP